MCYECKFVYKRVLTGVLSTVLTVATAMPVTAAIVPSEGKTPVAKKISVFQMGEDAAFSKELSKKDIVTSKFPSNAAAANYVGSEAFQVVLDGNAKGVKKGYKQQVKKAVGVTVEPMLGVDDAFMVTQEKAGEVGGCTIKIVSKAKNKKGKKVKFPFSVAFVADDAWTTAETLTATIDSELILVGESAQITATTTPEAITNPIEYLSSDEAVATVDATGKVTGVGEGKATIAVGVDQQIAAVEIAVINKPAYEPTESITLSEEAITLAEGQTATLEATVTPEGAAPAEWASSDEAVATVEDGVVTAVAAGTATVTATSGDKTAECEVTVVGDTEPPVVVESGVVDAWTLCVAFDEDIAKGEGYAVKVVSGELELETVDAIDGNALTISKADGSSFAAGTYTVTMTGVADLVGNVADELTTEVVKDNSIAVGFNAYEGYVAEYDQVKQANTNRYVHVTVSDQYGEAMDQVLSASYGTVTVKAYIKSSESIIESQFDKKGSTIDGRDMAHIWLRADEDFKAGETVVIEMLNKVGTSDYASTMEVEIVDYDMVGTIQTITEITPTTNKDVKNDNFVADENGGTMELSDNNKVFLMIKGVDFNKNNATKGRIKFVSSDPTVVKVCDVDDGTFGETAITGLWYDDAGDATVVTPETFGVWFEAQKGGEATITAYATGHIDEAFTYTVSVNSATLTLETAEAYNKRTAYLHIVGTEGIDVANMQGYVKKTERVNADNTRTNVSGTKDAVAGAIRVGTGSAGDVKLGLVTGEAYLPLNCAALDDNKEYVATVYVAAGDLAESEPVEVLVTPSLEIDSATLNTSEIIIDDGTAIIVNPSGTPTSIDAVTKDDPAEIGDKGTTPQAKGNVLYRGISILNVDGIEISGYAADENQIKLAWSDDTTGTGKTDLYVVNTTGQTDSKYAVLGLTMKTDEVIGTLTMSVGTASLDVAVNLGKAPYIKTIESKYGNEGKAVLINAKENGEFSVADATNNPVVLTLKDQYGTAWNTAATAPTAGTGNYGTLRVNGMSTTTGAGFLTIDKECQVNIAQTSNSVKTITFTRMYTGTHSLLFFVGDGVTAKATDPQVEVDVTFVTTADLDSVEIGSSVDFIGTDAKLKGSFPDAVADKAADECAGIFLDADTTGEVIKPSATVKSGEFEVAGVPMTWTNLDSSVSFEETWIATNTTPAGSQTVSGTNTAWATVAGATGEITIDNTGSTGIGASNNGTYDDLDNAAIRTDATIGEVWGAGALTLAKISKIAKLADSGKSTELTGNIHLLVNVTGTDLDDNAYVKLSNKGMSVSVDDMFLAYGAGNDADLGVSENDPVGESVKVLADPAKPTLLRIFGSDSTYGAALYDETTNNPGLYAANVVATIDGSGANGLIVGKDAAAVCNYAAGNVTQAASNESTVASDIVTVKATAGTAGKTASLRLPVKSGSKQGVITVPLEIVD